MPGLSRRSDHGSVEYRRSSGGKYAYGAVGRVVDKCRVGRPGVRGKIDEKYQVFKQQDFKQQDFKQQGFREQDFKEQDFKEHVESGSYHRQWTAFSLLLPEQKDNQARFERGECQEVKHEEL